MQKPTMHVLLACTLVEDLHVGKARFSLEHKCRGSCGNLLATITLTTSWSCCSHAWWGGERWERAAHVVGVAWLSAGFRVCPASVPQPAA